MLDDNRDFFVGSLSVITLTICIPLLSIVGSLNAKDLDVVIMLESSTKVSLIGLDRTQINGRAYVQASDPSNRTVIVAPCRYHYDICDDAGLGKLIGFQFQGIVSTVDFHTDYLALFESAIAKKGELTLVKDRVMWSGIGVGLCLLVLNVLNVCRRRVVIRIKNPDEI